MQFINVKFHLLLFIFYYIFGINQISIFILRYLYYLRLSVVNYYFHLCCFISIQLQYGTSPETEEPWDMDEVLAELGTGRFQVNMFILIGILLMFSNTSPLSFTLTAADLNYR